MPKPTRAPLSRAEQNVRDIGDILCRALADESPGYAFALCIASVGPANDGFFTHASNIERADLIKLLEEWRAKLIAGPPAPHGVLDREN